MDNRKQPTGKNEVVRGSLFILRRRCGKPTCRCVNGEPHETPVLSYSVKGATRLLTLRQEDVPAVKAALDRYRKELRDLDRQALAGIAAWRKRIVTAKARARHRR